MKSFIIKLVLLSLLFAGYIFYAPEAYKVIDLNTQNEPISYTSIFIFIGVLLFLNIFLKPILKIFSLPLSCMTLGLFSFVINFIIVILADFLIPEIQFTSYFNAFLFSIVFSFTSSVIDFFS
jgi:putative membrane protein